MRYVEARLRIKDREEAYRIYVTDALKTIAENTAKGGGKYMSMRYIDIFTPKETRTEEEIINMMKKKIMEGGDEDG